ncbi:MAG: MATE family efflux transporter [Acidobacteriota bacterium]
MRDLTEGSIPRHLIHLAVPIAVGMIFQTLYYLVDLYFVGTLGDTAIAGVSSAGNVQFLVMALTQVLGVGTMASISHAVGRKDQAEANSIFNQSLLIAGVCIVGVLAVGYASLGAFTTGIGADAATAEAGASYLRWYLPGLALQFILVAMGSTLSGTGIVKPGMIVQVLAVIINTILSPILIVGWGTGRPLGVAGAGLATTLSIAAGVMMMIFYFVRLEKYVGVDRRLLRPRWPIWGRILRIGVPPGGEFGLLFVYIGVVYWVIGQFGAEAQAGFGVGSRVMQAIFLPPMAIAFATAPLAGQNVGAGLHARVRQVFWSAALIGSTMMFALTLFCQWRPEIFIRGFTEDAAVIEVGADFLRIISWNFVASGLIFSCSGLFQALGNTIPALISSASRLATFVLPAIWMSRQPGFGLEQLWYLSVATVGLQALISLVFLRREMNRRLTEPTELSEANGSEKT